MRMRMHTRKSCSYILIPVVVVLFSVHYLGTEVLSVDTLKAGDELNSSSRLVSHNGLFALGFFTVYQTNNTYLAIWYINDENIPVWMANREYPFPKDSAPLLTISTGGELAITAGGGRAFVLYGGGSVQNATLLNTGNFVVKSNNGELVWQSFDHPTDTLLPSMKLGLNSTLSSWFSSTNPVPGAFTMEWDPVSHRLFIRRRGVIYWTSGGLKDYSDYPNKRGKEFENFDPSDSSNLNYNVSDEEEYVTYSLRVDPVFTPDDRKVISRWTLDYQGMLYDGGGRPVIAMADECYGYNANWSVPYKGCEIRDLPKCRNHSVRFDRMLGDFRPINGTSAAPSVHDANSSLTESDCRDICWNDCECVGYVKNDGDGCVYWRDRDLEFHGDLEGSRMNIRRYVLVSKSSSSPSSSSTKGKQQHMQFIIIGVVVGSVVLITLGIALFILHIIKRGKREEEELHNLLTLEGYTETLENGGAKNHDLKLFTYASILTATSNFSPDNKLGQGGFGSVYKGKTPEGQDIAVKVLSRQSGQGLLEFKTELVLISKLQHVNLVKLQGFCIHGDDKMIIYDYMHNKSLDFFLFSESKRGQLDWKKRFNIIEGIAHGLLYLHKYSRLRIIHRDLKPSNILLDENMNPKISDFGLARIFKHNVSEANTNRRVGTYGYMAPEYAMRGLFSDKSDVYSFGVLVLEIVSGQKMNSFHEIEGPLSIVEYAWELWRKDCAVELMDPTLKDCCIVDQLQRCIQIGLLCVENLAADRPAIGDVVSMLKNDTSSLPMPKNPAFITRNSVLQLAEKSFPQEKVSANEATISEMQGR